MADAVRVGLLGVSLGAVIASSVLLVSRFSLGATATVLALWIAGVGQIVLLAEVLSLLHALDWPGFLLGHLLILGAAVGWGWRRPANRWRGVREIQTGLGRLAPLIWDRSVPALLILAGATLLVGLISLALAVWVPPNLGDSLAYHMSRVGYYLQFRSLDHYPTDDPRQVAFPPNAELLILWTVAFLRSDVLANGVSLVAWVSTIVGVYGLGRQIGLGPRPALFGGGVFGLLPQTVLQSSSTWNDLVVTSFVVASLYFLFETRVERERREGVRPLSALTLHSRLVLAGAAAGLALGTKGTAAWAVPGLAVALLVVFARRVDRGVLAGALLGGLAAVLLGSYVYVQNWLVFGSPTGPLLMVERPTVSWEGFVPNLARILYRFVFADLHGPLSSPVVRPLVDPVVPLIGAAGERVFAAFGIPTFVEGRDIAWWDKFSFALDTRFAYSTGVGPIGGLMLAAALVALVWPGGARTDQRLLAMVALSYLALFALTFPWNPWGGRFLLTPCALAAPLLGALLWDPERGTRHAARKPTAPWAQRPAFRQGFTLVVAAWSAATGLYLVAFNPDKPLPLLIGRDRPGLISPRTPVERAWYEELDLELGPRSTVGVYGSLFVTPASRHQWEYPFFGARFTRTVIPLVRAEYPARMGRNGPLPWSNETLVATYGPAYIFVESHGSAAEELLGILPNRCFPVPLEYGRPTLPAELWRCRDDDPRSVLENGDFRAEWDRRGEERGASLSARSSSLPIGWYAEVSGEGRLDVSWLEEAPDEEPFRVRLDYRAGDAEDEAGIVQEVPLGGLRGQTLVADARVRVDRVGAAVLWVDDGVTATEIANATTGAETLRVIHRIDPRATELSVHLDASGAGGDATVLVRTLLAIPRGP